MNIALIAGTTRIARPSPRRRVAMRAKLTVAFPRPLSATTTASTRLPLAEPRRHNLRIPIACLSTCRASIIRGKSGVAGGGIKRP